MRRALQGKASRVQTAAARSVPAPVGGWDTESPLANMPKQNAIILDNFIPRAGYVELRRGFTQQVTGTSAGVESLIAWRGAAIGDQLFACAGPNIYNVTTAGAIGAPVWTASAITSSARYKSVNFSNDAGKFAICVNGVNIPLKYDGAAFGELIITGTAGPLTLNPATISDVMAHKQRLFFLEDDSLRVWYLEVTAIQGACGLLDLGGFFPKGGQLVAQGTWSLDGGAGIDDVAVFVTTEGQVAIFQGTDPNDVNNWSLVGVYDLARPLGTRALIKYGADLAIVTEDGVLPLSQALNKDRSQDNRVALTAKIATAFSKAAISYAANFGWQGLLYPGRGSLAIFNVPTAEGTAAVQFVQSMQTGAWCRFTGIPAICWEMANGMPYFGASDGVYQWDLGSSDNGEIIVGDVKPAFNSFGTSQQKQATMIRPLIKAPATIRPSLEMLADYRETAPTAVPTVVTPGDISTTDDDAIRYDWTSATALGYVLTPRMRVALVSSSDVERISYDGVDLILTETAGDFVITRDSLPLDVDIQLIGFDLMFIPGGQL